MAVIHKLDTEISNKIAAGEVVERPASVIKELVENSIDAGATKITVRIERGGVAKMTVTDNGCGMAREDAELAFLRHATSKIHTVEDLDAIYTLGFRGEALSSIAAVAHVDLYTKREQDEMGTHAVCTGDGIHCTEEGAADGTTMIVSDLFYNTPARMKFLKKDATEGSYISDLMVRFILAHPEISFSFFSNGKEQFRSPGDNRLSSCVYAVYGKAYAEATIPVSYEENGIRISGLIGKSSTARANRSYQSYFVNHRLIKSVLITKAVEEGFKNQIMIGKFPMAILNLDIDARLIDINVHPTKQEVKFSRESDIFVCVKRAVENALYQTLDIPKRILPEEKKKSEEPVKKEVFPKRDTGVQLPLAEKPQVISNEQFQKKLEEHFPFPKAEPVQMKKLSEPLPDSYRCDTSPEYFAKKKQEIISQMEAPRPAAEPPEMTKIPETVEKPVEDAVAEPEEIPYFRVIGQVFKTYILVERGEEMLMIDQHAAHERIKYEELKRELSEKRVASQGLLLPVTVDLSAAEFEIYQENKALFEELGFEAEEFGRSSVILRMTPAAVEPEDISDVFIEMLTQISESKDKILTKKSERALYTIACKAAAKANRKMEQQEMEGLVRGVFGLGTINTCPHGRPITISMSKKEMEKEFKRIV